MSRKAESFNPQDTSNFCKGQKIPSLERIFAKFLSLKRRGNELLGSMKTKFARDSGEKKNVHEASDETRTSKFSSDGPDICHCHGPKPRSKADEIGATTIVVFGKGGKSSVITEPGIETFREHLDVPRPHIENTTQNVGEELLVLKDPENDSELSFRLPVDGSIIDPESKQSVEEQRKSSNRSQHPSPPLPFEFMERIDEVEAESSAKEITRTSVSITKNEQPPEVSENLPEERKVSIARESDVKNEKSPAIPVVEQKIEKEKLIENETVNISRKTSDETTKNSVDSPILRIHHEISPPNVEDASIPLVGEVNLGEEWKNVHIPVTTNVPNLIKLPQVYFDRKTSCIFSDLKVIKKIVRIAKPKRGHKCPRGCPCKYTQKLIDEYHAAKILSIKADKMIKRSNHCKYRLTKSEISFFQEDTETCNVMIGETRSRRAELRKLTDMWQKTNENLAIRREEILSIISGIEWTTKRLREVENILDDWLPEGKMEQLRKTQRTLENENEEGLELLEDRERLFGKEKTEEVLRERESWLKDEKLRQDRQKNQRIRGTLNLQNATKLMQRYIDERKSLLTSKNEKD